MFEQFKQRFPRIRGDVPNFTSTCKPTHQFSPHTRGCSLACPITWCTKKVFPAYAGMFRCKREATSPNKSFPRIRGDVPSIESKKDFRGTFSPHTRGCSWCAPPAVDDSIVFPAYAGMFRSPWGFRQGSIRFPRIRGDVPCTSRTRRVGTWFSPHTRGCSVERHPFTRHVLVFPAYAGMFREMPRLLPFCLGFPRIRGDVPIKVALPVICDVFSPHTRGCSVDDLAVKVVATVFPAYAGMFLLLVGLGVSAGVFPAYAGMFHGR